jgi:hypothetical protein
MTLVHWDEGEILIQYQAGGNNAAYGMFFTYWANGWFEPIMPYSDLSAMDLRRDWR